MHDLVLHLKVCYVVSLETYIIDIMYMITHIVDSALERFNRMLITAGYIIFNPIVP
jgi:hypothetical protein